MILVTLGTQDKSFDRLLKEIDKQIELGNIKDKVIVQAGHTKYKSKNMEIFDLVEEEELEKLVSECNLLITHGGVGSILMGIKHNKKIIAVPRLKEFKEHTNDHQIQIIKEFSKAGYIIKVDKVNDLENALEEIKKFKPKKFKSNNEKFVKKIEDYIDDDNHTSWYNRYNVFSNYGYQGIVFSFINLIIFSNLIINLKYNMYINALIAFLITLVIELIVKGVLRFYKNIKKDLIVNKIALLIVDIVLMFIVKLFLNISIPNIKLVDNIIQLLLSYFFIKVNYLLNNEISLKQDSQRVKK